MARRDDGVGRTARSGLRGVILAASTVATACGVGGAPANAPPGSIGTLEPGDSVVYAIARAGAPYATMTRKVIERHGDRLTIDVVLARGAERRHVVEVSRDDADARAQNAVEELYLVRDDGERVRAPAARGVLLELYEWIYVMARADAANVTHAPCDVDVAGAKFSCTCETATQDLGKAKAQSVEARCDAFAWTRGPASWRDASTGAPIWEISVLSTTK